MFVWREKSGKNKKVLALIFLGLFCIIFLQSAIFVAVVVFAFSFVLILTIRVF